LAEYKHTQKRRIFLRERLQKILIFQDRFYILLEMRLSGVVEQIMQGYMGNPG